jgi:hypothetical protein
MCLSILWGGVEGESDEGDGSDGVTKNRGTNEEDERCAYPALQLLSPPPVAGEGLGWGQGPERAILNSRPSRPS